MTSRVVALTGISGVGKSTFVKSLIRSIPLHHFQAGELIKAGRDATPNAIAHDRLRHADTDENQLFLIQGFERKAAFCRGLIVLDGHTIVEKENQLILINSAIFGAIGTEIMIFLFDDPHAIMERRRNDISRNRPLPSVEHLEEIQHAAEKQATTVCRALHIELYLRRPTDLTSTVALLQKLCPE